MPPLTRGSSYFTHNPVYKFKLRKDRLNFLQPVLSQWVKGSISFAGIGALLFCVFWA